MRFKDSVAIITGGGTGIGESISIKLAEEGANITLCGRNMESLKETAKKIEKLGRQALPIRADVSRSEDVKSLIDQTLHRFGKINILVNNAGIHSITFFTEISDDLWDETIAINVRGVFLCSREVAKQMIKQASGGKIVNIASMAAKMGIEKSAHYCASKFAVLGLTQASAMDLAKYKINVNAVCPGLVETDMLQRLIKIQKHLKKKTSQQVIDDYRSSIPLGRFAQPDEVAEIVAFFCSKKADYMTGQAINITGGWITH